MSRARDKVLMSLGGVAGLSVLAWQTMFPWLKYDLHHINQTKPMGEKMVKDLANQRYLIEMFEESVAKHPQKTMVIFANREYTFELVNEQAKMVANIAYEWRFKTGETVALLIQNHPAFIWTFLGLQKVGLNVAFLNYHNRGKPLLHTIIVSKAQAMVIGPEEDLYRAVEEIRHDLEIPLYVYGSSRSNVPAGFISWDDLMIASSTAEICKTHRHNYNLLTPCANIFSSGTTGLPKPVIVNQERAIKMSKVLCMVGVTPDDIIYTTTPLYHAAALFALFGVIDAGATMVLRSQFSASHFFEDCRRHNVTIAVYIGELARYLLHVPASPEDGKHNIRVMLGNGLRADIWEKFQKRFKIPKIVEYFGASEGPVGFSNTWGKVGSCGRLSPFLNMISPMKSYIVRYDPKTYLPLRNKSGRCIPCNIGTDGRAGMAGILLKESVDFKSDLLPEIYQHCEKNLPSYARPMFLRFIKEMPLTTTLKQKKVEYVKEGFNPAIINDPLFRISPETSTYVTLTTENFGMFLAKSRL
ncbi:long-chain fatty acid transport protein 2-like isoform X2 [Ostrea edulis]|uniref:long-chain fatty acid transport protein 2-like isoform X2 n=1 Tax=Ostrea edulis TaxID=37623 RepID=UPI0024AE9769|nr:long-chain fatty acid transport protein 2-like isoform X2 [Ostrea edulis]